MADTTFTSGTVVQASWLNEINDAIYNQTSGLTGGIARTLSSKLGDFISVKDFGADSTGVSDSTAAVTLAMTAGKNIYFPAGTYLVNISLANKRGYSFIGAGKDITMLKNFTSSPVFTFDNTLGDAKQNRIAHMRIQSRDEAVYTTTDGIFFTGSAANEMDFNVFHDLEILDFRHAVNISARTIWNSWIDCHFFSNINDGFHVVTIQNVSQQSFVNCRFGANGSYGLQTDKASGDLFMGWAFIGCTFEKNGLTGIRHAGAAAGVQGFTYTSCYFEENTTAVAGGAVSPRKANIWVDAQYCIGLDIRANSLWSTPLATELDYGLYIEDACTNCSVDLGANRWDSGFAINAYRIPSTATFFAGPQFGASIISAPNTKGSTALVNLAPSIKDSYTGSLTGCTTVPTGTIRQEKVDEMVTIQIPAIEATSNATTATITGMNAAMRPARTQTVIVPVKDNGTVSVGLAQIGTDGVITLQLGIGGGSFTGSGTKGIREISFSYLLT